MARKVFSLIVLSFFGSFAYAQHSSEYTEWIRKAISFYEAKQYSQSADAFTHAFASNGGLGQPDDRYNAACSWAQAGNKDSAFFQLNRIATKANFMDLNHLLVDSDLESLHKDKRWKDLCELVKQNKEKAEVNLNKPLVAILATIYQDDQNGRMQIMDMQKKYGNDSKEMRALWKTINEKDSLDLIKVERILDKYGWLGPDVIGANGNITLFLVIQHSDIKVQEKYLPVMRDAVRDHKARPDELALLEDRVALRQGRKQIYGSQIGTRPDGQNWISPLEDPDNVDKRRAEVGLEPLADYAMRFNIKWDVAAYKKQLRENEEKEKK
jgi:hypothetical protein